MTMEKLKEANELARQISKIEQRIEGVRIMLGDENYEIDIVAHQAGASETLFEGDEAKDMLRKHLVDLTAKHELMLTEFERL